MSEPSEAAMRCVRKWDAKEVPQDELEKVFEPTQKGVAEMMERRRRELAKIIDEEFAPAIAFIKGFVGVDPLDMGGDCSEGIIREAEEIAKQLGIPLEEND